MFKAPRKSKSSNNNEPTLPLLPRTSMEVEKGLERWNQHFGPRCSSPSRPEWDSFIQGSLQVLTQSQLQEQELRIHQNKRISELEQKISKCQHICKYGSITGREGLEIQEKKKQEEKKAELKSQQRIRDKL